MRNVFFLLILSLFCFGSLFAQSPNATINGLVLDPSGAAITGAQIVVVNDATGAQYVSKTNGEGIYVVPNLPPGSYHVQVSNTGFKTIIKPDIILNVQDALAINFTLPLGAASEIVTVQGGAPLLNTTNASVSTVVDRTYVANIPLNGRSFQDLILLTPGVVTSNPQSPASSPVGYRGEFSVNGQRTESNYYSVDGVGSNIGAVSGSPFAGTAGITGSLPSATALGTTQSLVSVDALQEFRVQSSTYSAEYGRNPGGQFSFATRSGTNQWHGTAFDYLRNDFFDANNWFNNFFGKAEPPLRQNDFGGTLGGPIRIPRLYDGKDKTFFFFSYEGLRLIQPQAAVLNNVPDLYLRTCTTGPLQQAMEAFPKPSRPSPLPDCTMPDPGDGLAQFIGTWSNPSHIDSYSIRFDHTVNTKLKLFFRFSDTPSSQTIRQTGDFNSPAVKAPTTFEARTYTFGASSILSPRFANELRLNYSSNDAAASQRIDGFGGGQAVDLAQLSGLNSSAYLAVNLFFPSGFPSIYQYQNSGAQKQWNLVDTLSLSVGRHQLKFGGDYRRLMPIGIQASPIVQYNYFSANSVRSGTADQVFAVSSARAYPVYVNFSAFADDEWRLTPRLTLSQGLRWEVNPAPGVSKGTAPYTVEGSSLSTLTLAPQGTPLWKTTWYNFAPRLGIAYVLRNAPGWEMVVRGGGGVFFDTGQQTGAAGFQGPGLGAFQVLGPSPFPLPASTVTPSIVNPPVAPYGRVFAFPSHLQLPYTLQWNASVAQALGESQALTATYVGAHASRLLQLNEVLNTGNPNISALLLYKNGLTSDYDALQVQFQRRLSRGLQALASYSWAHGIDYGSSNANVPYVRGNSDFDIRHAFTGALSYEPPSRFTHGLASVLFEHWAVDDRLTARTGFPVTLNGDTLIDPVTGQQYNAGLNIQPGQPLYVSGAQYPGGRSINPGAFAPPVSGKFGNAPRNFARGFGAWQMDLAVRREFPLHEQLKLQFRAEAFNVFNHPDFGTINPNFGEKTFGQATATLANSLGILSPLYQMGGPRSMQFALKIIF